MTNKRKKPCLMQIREIDPATGKTTLKTVNAADLHEGKRRHKTLSTELKQKADALFERVGHLLGHTSETWLDGFFRDMHPDQEIDIWERIADVVDDLCQSKPEEIVALDRATILDIVVLLSADAVDIPSQLPGVTNEQVACVREAYDGFEQE
jgi:hypothetical protein